MAISWLPRKGGRYGESVIVEQISAAIGAKVSGIDLCAGISDTQRDEILDALHRHHEIGRAHV